MFDLPKYGDGSCLARLADLLRVLDIDRDRLRRSSVVVTGSNGKGSTAAFCASIGHAAGLRSGLFTSPHLYRFNERFQIDGAPIDDVDLADLTTRIMAAIDIVSQRVNERFGAFEAQFALACLYFQEAGCDFAVFEAGIGGRYDPVRLVGATDTCMTSVDYEHVNLLGNSLVLIAFDKSDACAAGGTVIYGENCRSLRAHLVEYNRNRNVDGVFVRDEIRITDERTTTGGQRFDLDYGKHHFEALEIRLTGGFQINNAAIAIVLFLRWRESARERDALQARTGAIEPAIRAGLLATRWPGRLELVRDKPVTVVDVGHTPDGIQRSLDGLYKTYGIDGWLLVTGVSSDKKADEIVTLLAPSFEVIVCTAAYHKGSDPQQIAAAARRANPNAAIHVAATIEDAVALSTTLAASQNRRIFVAGGLFLAIEYATVARGGRTKDLAFF